MTLWNILGQPVLGPKEHVTGLLGDADGSPGRPQHTASVHMQGRKLAERGTLSPAPGEDGRGQRGVQVSAFRGGSFTRVTFLRTTAGWFGLDSVQN